MTYYNENDPKAAEWLRELIRAELIAPGVVDETSITEIKRDELDRYTQCHFFAGIGGWSYALWLAGWPDNKPVWTGSCPCQPFSAAGKGQVDKDKRHLWPAFRGAIAICKPATVFGEQVASKDGKIWFAGVRADLEALGYCVGAADLCAACVGAPHIRQRIYWVAHAPTSRLARTGKTAVAFTNGTNHLSQREDARIESSGCGESNGLVLTNRAGRDAREQTVKTLGYRSAAESTSGARGLADTNGSESGHGDLQSSRGHLQLAEDETTRGLADNFGERLEKRDIEAARKERETAERSCANSWNDFSVIACADGKARRIESGTFPLAHGVSGRVGLLRGYGNAIVPQLAAEFIQAACESFR